MCMCVAHSSFLAMVGRRKTLEHVPHIKKFLDHSRDPLKRLKALRTALGALLAHVYSWVWLALVLLLS